MEENHAPVYIAHNGTKRTHDLTALQYWWPGMRKAIGKYVRLCDSCQRKKEDREFVAPLGTVQERTAPFEVTAMDVSAQGQQIPSHIYRSLTRYAEAYTIPYQKGGTYARIYATHIITRHGTGSELITDQGAAFMSSFFEETCKVLVIRRSRTTNYHPASNGQNGNILSDPTHGDFTLRKFLQELGYAGTIFKRLPCYPKFSNRVHPVLLIVRKRDATTLQ
jgi:hypothetical protein